MAQALAGAVDARAESAASVRAKRERRFFTGLVAAIVVTNFLGFGRTYFLRFAFGEPTGIFGHALNPLNHLHGFLFTSFLVLLIVQVRLIAAQRTALHRSLGYAGAVLGAVMVVVGVMTAIASARRGFPPPGNGPPPLSFVAVPLTDLLVFVTLFAAGIYLRNRAEAHKRLVVLAAIGIVTPSIARLPLVFALGPPAFFLLTDLFIVALAIFDRRLNGRVHPATKWGGLWIVLSQPLRLVVSLTPAWVSFATWLTS